MPLDRRPTRAWAPPIVAYACPDCCWVADADFDRPAHCPDCGGVHVWDVTAKQREGFLRRQQRLPSPTSELRQCPRCGSIQPSYVGAAQSYCSGYVPPYGTVCGELVPARSPYTPAPSRYQETDAERRRRGFSLKPARNPCIVCFHTVHGDRASCPVKGCTCPGCG